MDSFRITKNGTTFFEDPFNDGKPPPNTDERGGTSTANYSENGTFTEMGGKLVLSSSGAGRFRWRRYGPVFCRQCSFGCVQHRDGSDLVSGLKIDDTVTIEGTFDLSALPDSAFESFGIRFMDRAVSGGPNTPPQAGDDSVEVRVVRLPNGSLNVVMSERSWVEDTNQVIQSFSLNPPAGADQITLRLTYAPSASGVGPTAVSGSFDYLAGGAVVGHQDFTMTGEIFNGENWTRAQLIAVAPGTSDASMDGAYGVLTLNQSGTWSYALDNESAAVQALTANDTVTDTFQVRVVDTDGFVDTKTLTITVHGTDELLV